MSEFTSNFAIKTLQVGATLNEFLNKEMKY